MIAPKFVKPTCPRWIEHLKLSSRHCAGALGRQVPLALAEPGSLADRSTIGHVLLRDPNLPEAMLPLDWPGRTARGLCHTLYGALLDVSEAYLHRVVEVADGSLLDANRSLRLRFGAGAQAADGN
ncbi:hypothetical protein N6G06_26500 [Cupriavidus gilardii]|uniref:PaaX family transcriptional regulator C-terminal domain-containing protein n=1 Tax=Cupriavidus gilardii TaxID=82541 RepID=UPI0021BE7978|nr:PaaX family transcriptional regulator C-terminal domain-containing protein [Cupriavidus gilardii]MCT9074900.1 hypothetical protein [Cupriavidus gilardii]